MLPAASPSDITSGQDWDQGVSNSSGKGVVVTGAAAGIGYAIAKRFAADAYRTAVVDLDEERACAAAASIAEETGGMTLAATADVADFESCRAAHDRIVSEFGPVSVLVNNAGIMSQRLGRIEALPPEHFDDLLAIHVRGAVNWARLVTSAMREAKFGRIINISSGNAKLAVPYRLAYVTAKKAILGITEALALETARDGITVNAILPGYIATRTLLDRADAGILDKDSFAERTPVGRWGRPDEIARVAAFLADADSGFITGSTLVVDGGITIRGDPHEDLSHPPYPQG
ncbi:MAG: SDR family oxidoreductase [Boseongicola sp. SB0675_bin_26]|nr:SDR family oxidoreductase [Boseongicola sp. SB0675_bin_26]